MNALSALADPTRKQIVELLAGREISAGDIARRFDVSPPAVSQHLRALREARLVKVRVEAQRRIYSLDRAGFDEVGDWLERVRSFWLPRLDTLEAALAHPAPQRRRAPPFRGRKRK
jgi:DNA-binding transcriptional ArsR family regulator